MRPSSATRRVADALAVGAAETGEAPWVPPERLLLIAMLELALKHLHYPARTDGRTAAAEARAWVVSDDVVWEFSFRRVCEHLNLNVERAREALLGPRHSVRRPPRVVPRRAQEGRLDEAAPGKSRRGVHRGRV